MQVKTVNKIFGLFQHAAAIPKTELRYTNNFTLLIAVILSAQSTDMAVNKATEYLFANYDSPEKLLALGTERLKDYIKTIGLYNVKAAGIMMVCQILIDQHRSQVPDDFQQLIALPQVGRKTANVVLNCGFNHPTIGVDTHVFRVAKRLGLAEGSTPEKVESELLQNIPARWLLHAHHWLILHGRYICKARTPQCYKCLVARHCDYYQKLPAAG